MKKRSSLLRIIRESRKQWPGLIVVLLLSLLAGLFKIGSAAAWGNTVDSGISGNFETVRFWLLAMLLFLLLDGIRTAVVFRIIGHTTESLFFTLRQRVFTVLTRGEIPALRETVTSGDAVTRVNSDLEDLCAFVSGELPEFFRRYFMAGLAIAASIFIAWELLVIYLILLPISIAIMNRISGDIQKQTLGIAQHTGKAATFSASVLFGQQTVKSFALEEEMNRQYRDINQTIYENGILREKKGMKMAVVKQVSLVVQTMLVYLVGLLLVYYGRITPGAILIFAMVSNYIADAFQQIDRFISGFKRGDALAERVYQVLDLPLQETDGKLAPNPLAEMVVSAKNLSFTYGREKVLDNVNIALRRGQCIGIIGPSGCGKSTLVHMICGFYPPTEGNLQVFDQNMDSLQKDALWQNIALISQDAGLFYGSIYDNVAYGRQDAGKDAVDQAISRAALNVSRFPQGAKTQVGESGKNLSGGEKQRAGIARAILKNASLFILDEATSALDLETEAAVQATLETVLRGHSAIVVAHRILTVKDVDYLYCMDNGSVLEEGTPKELYTRKGYFYRMCVKQGVRIRGDEDE